MQEDPGDNPGEGTSDRAATNAAAHNQGGNLSRKAKSRAPVKRQRSVSIPPPGGLKWKDKIKKQLKHQLWDHKKKCAICTRGRGHEGKCEAYRQAKARQSHKGATQGGVTRTVREPELFSGEPSRTFGSGSVQNVGRTSAHHISNLQGVWGSFESS